MMTNEKLTLMEQIRKQRFLPITNETPTLYERFNCLVDTHNPDELSFLRFHEGEYYFRIGDFDQSLEHLTRCLSAPKSGEYRYLNALSYNIIGLIYGLLDMQHVSLNYLLLFRSMCQELQLTREAAICYINLSLIYGELDAYDIALTNLDTALSLIHTTNDNEDYSLLLLCEVYRGIFYCKMNNRIDALKIYHSIEPLTESNRDFFYNAAMFDFCIRLSSFLPDSDAHMAEYLSAMLAYGIKAPTFLEVSDFYFGICDYFLEQRRQAECSAMLDFIASATANFSTCCLTYDYLTRRATYTRYFGTDHDYLDCCDAVISLRSRYLTEKNHAKLCSLSYIEHLHQAKSDSQMFLEKSRTDQLTGLLNKYTIQFLVTEDLASVAPQRHPAMLLLDLDHFKQINDTLGHLVGDSFIQQTASAISNYFKENALCGRVGGDEFLIYVRDVRDRSLLILQAEILRQEIFTQTSKNNVMVSAQASIGIAFFSEYRYNYETLFSAADHALYQAKKEGRNKVVIND